MHYGHNPCPDVAFVWRSKKTEKQFSMLCKRVRKLDISTFAIHMSMGIHIELWRMQQWVSFTWVTYITHINRNRTVLIDVHIYIQKEPITCITLLTFDGQYYTVCTVEIIIIGLYLWIWIQSYGCVPCVMPLQYAKVGDDISALTASLKKHALMSALRWNIIS